MTSVAPSPDSPVGALPNSTAILSPPITNSTTSAPPSTQPNANSDPPPPSSPSNSNSTSPPTQSPPPSVPSAPPPASLSPPPPTPVALAPPPEPSTTPALPPPPTTTPVPNPPSAPPPAPSTPVVSPPPPNRAPPPVSPTPPAVNAPPPQEVSPPSPPTPVVSPPPELPSSPPPPTVNSPPPLPSVSPPPPLANPPDASPAPPTLTPPPVSQPTSPAPPNSPPARSPPPANQTQPTPSTPSPPSLGPSQNNSDTGPSRNNSDTGGSSLVPTPLTPIEPNSPPNTGLETPGNGNSTNSGGMNTGGAVAIGIIVGFVVLGFIGVAIWFWRKQKRKVTGYHAGHVMPSPLGSSPVSDTSYIKAHSSAPLMASRSGSEYMYSPPESGALGNSRSVFTYEELVEATDGFSTQKLLGEGGFGCVYKGILTDGREVAVKQLKIGGSQGEREFSAEVETISRVHHRHLVSLVGYCISEHQRLLVYDYVSNNTLYYHLHGNSGTVMDWPTRVKVATGAARGISYLHEDCHPRIIHRDIKSSNILLDDSFDAQVADFGLAKLTSDVYTHISTRVMGTFGYMAPEYASSGKLTDRSDVYSFGVVLLELITGRKPVDESQPLGDESLVEWARPLMNDALANQEIRGLIDPRLENNYVETEVIRMIEAAAACVRHSATKRPRMGQVVRALDAIDDSSDLTNGIRPGQSEVFSSSLQSAEIRMFQRMAFGTQDYSSDIFSQSSYGS